MMFEAACGEATTTHLLRDSLGDNAGEVPPHVSLKHINRPHKHKDKKGSSCKMCKPHKNGWARSTKDKEFQMRKGL